MIVLGLFLRPQLAFWVVVGIPVSFAGGVIVMHLFGMSANMMSLFGFIIVVGVVVDDAIVVLENVYHRIEQGEDPLVASYLGTRQVGFAIISTTLVVCAVFVGGEGGAAAV